MIKIKGTAEKMKIYKNTIISCVEYVMKVLNYI